MTGKDFNKLFKAITSANISDEQKDDAVTTVLDLASRAFTKDILQSLIEAKDTT